MRQALVFIKSWRSFTFLILIRIFIVLSLAFILLISVNKNFFFVIEIPLLFFNFTSISIIFLVDQWRGLFFLTVSLIRLAVMSFSSDYLKVEVHYSRFHFLLSGFIFSIILLIFRPGLFSLFLGWDGLGLRSFLLVIYYRNNKALNAGLLTFFTNRLGDGLLLSGLTCGLLNWNFNTLTIEVNSCKDYFLVAFLVFGACTKRAQVPFSAWLPAAIAAPTPVSALVHSSTLVTAGIYLIFRLRDLLPRFLLKILFFIGLTTIILARLRALTETDIKKIVALSTLRQLGLIIIALGLRNFSLSFFHLITHAFFKALIFISVGEIIIKSGGFQNLKIIGTSSFSPAVLGMLIGSKLRLIGFPFFSGFFRKEIILEFSTRFSELSIVLYLLFFLRVFLTQLYRVRFIYKVVLSSLNFISVQDFSFLKKKSKVAFSLLIFPACLAGSFLRSFLILNVDFLVTPKAVKILTLRIVFLVILLFPMFLKFRLNRPTIWFIRNLWLIPVFSGSLPSLLYLRRDTRKKIFFSSILENMFLIRAKKTGYSLFNFRNWIINNSLGLSFLLLLLVVVI